MPAQKKTDEVFKQYFQNNECSRKIITLKEKAEYVPAFPQTVDKAGAGVNLRHRFCIKDNFSLFFNQMA